MKIEKVGIKEILAEIFPNQLLEINDDDSFVDKLGMDSITFVSYVIGIENKFNIEVPDDYSLPSKLDTINKTCNMLEKERR